MRRGPEVADYGASSCLPLRGRHPGRRRALAGRLAQDHRREGCPRGPSARFAPAAAPVTNRQYASCAGGGRRLPSPGPRVAFLPIIDRRWPRQCWAFARWSVNAVDSGPAAHAEPPERAAGRARWSAPCDSRLSPDARPRHPLARSDSRRRTTGKGLALSPPSTRGVCDHGGAVCYGDGPTTAGRPHGVPTQEEQTWPRRKRS